MNHPARAITARRAPPGVRVGLGLLVSLGTASLVGCGHDNFNDSALYPPCHPDQDSDNYFSDTGDCLLSDGSIRYFSGQIDCNDLDSAIFPYAEELPDGRDNNCDGRIDEGTPTTDDDGDGFTEEQGDCNDGDSSAYPGAAETAGDEIDSNCDGYDFSRGGVDIEDPSTYPDSDPSKAAAILYGDQQSANYIGWAGYAGDLDGDGRDDVVFAQGLLTREGGVYGEVGVIYSPEGGISGAIPYTDADWTVTGVGIPNTVGTLIQHGDLNGDGFQDLVIGDFAQRRVSVFYGGAQRRSGAFSADQANVTFRPLNDGAWPIGGSLAIPGDLDQDGFDDLVIGQPTFDYNSGRTLIIYGRPQFNSLEAVDDADAALNGEYEFDLAGNFIAGLRDLDGDGYPDFAVGAPASVVTFTDESGNVTSGVGRLYVYYGGPQRMTGDLELKSAPAILTADPSLASILAEAQIDAGDVDGDDHADLVVGVPAMPTQGNGGVAVVYGTGQRLSGEHTLISLAATQLWPRDFYDTFATSLSVADVTGDGIDDMVVACALNSGNDPTTGYPQVGYVAMFEGRTERPAIRYVGDSEGDVIDGAYGLMEAIYMVSAAGDANQDGKADVLVGSEYYPYDTPHSTVLLFHGGELP